VYFESDSLLPLAHKTLTNILHLSLPCFIDAQMYMLIKYTRAALKVMPPTLLYWPMTSEINVGVTAVKVEPSQEYSVTFCCLEIDSSRGAF